MCFVEVPVFAGEDLRPWIDWMEQYFARYDDFTDLQKMAFAQSFIEGKAEKFVRSRQWMLPLDSWDEMKESLLLQFGRIDDPERIKMDREHDVEWQKILETLQKDNLGKKQRTPKIQVVEAFSAHEPIPTESSIHEAELISATESLSESESISEIEAETNETNMETDGVAQPKVSNSELEPSFRFFNEPLSVVGEWPSETVRRNQEHPQSVFESEKNKNNAHKVFDGLFLRSHQKKKLCLSPKSWKFKFKKRTLLRKRSQMDLLQVIDLSNLKSRCLYSSASVGLVRKQAHMSRVLYQVRILHDPGSMETFFLVSMHSMFLRVEDKAAAEIFPFIHDFQSASSTMLLALSISTTILLQNVQNVICISQRPWHCLVHVVNNTVSHLWHRWKSKVQTLHANSEFLRWGLVHSAVQRIAGCMLLALFQVVYQESDAAKMIQPLISVFKDQIQVGNRLVSLFLWIQVQAYLFTHSKLEGKLIFIGGSNGDTATGMGIETLMLHHNISVCFWTRSGVDYGAGQAIDAMVSNFQVMHRWRNKELQLLILLFQVQQHSDPSSPLVHEWNPSLIKELLKSFWIDVRLDIHNSAASLTLKAILDSLLRGRNEFQIHHKLGIGNTVVFGMDTRQKVQVWAHLWLESQTRLLIHLQEILLHVLLYQQQKKRKLSKTWMFKYKHMTGQLQHNKLCNAEIPRSTVHLIFLAAFPMHLAQYKPATQQKEKTQHDSNAGSYFSFRSLRTSFSERGKY